MNFFKNFFKNVFTPKTHTPPVPVPVERTKKPINLLYDSHPYKNRLLKSYHIGTFWHPAREIYPKGVKLFLFGDNAVFAINQKNANRKAVLKGILRPF